MQARTRALRELRLKQDRILRLIDRAGRNLSDHAWRGHQRSLADELLEPSRIYAPALLKLSAEVPVHAFAAVGWGWGGNWSSTPDYQHFSSNGR